MSDSATVDARGLSCPEPVLLVQQALRDNAASAFAVLVSSPTARDNVERALQGAGRVFALTAEGEDWRFTVEAK